MLFLITLGTILSAVFFGLIQWVSKIYPITISITTPNECQISTNGISFEVKLILSALLSIYFTYLIDKLRHKKHTKEHFTHSHKIVTKRIIEIYSKKSILNDYRDINRSIDRIIKSPLEYAAETLNGNLAPCFNPDHHGFNEMYNDDVKLIIAVTAENPNLWLDPTICFYLINCCAVSLLKNTNNTTGIPRKLTMQNYGNSLTYQDEIQNHLDILSRLTQQQWNWTTDLQNFDFFRFFLYNGEQRESLENTVFPSLKASHDLFKMKTYFNQRTDIENQLSASNRLDDFYGHINFLWDEIARQNLSDAFRKIIDKRKKEHIPEFLFLFKTIEEPNIHSVTVHTFVDGVPYFVEYRESATNNNGYQIVQSLVSYIAQGIQNAGIAQQYIPAGRYLNANKSYIDWI
jgi:hypothetical protein